jgi:hypothetical protein
VKTLDVPPFAAAQKKDVTRVVDTESGAMPSNSIRTIVYSMSSRTIALFASEHSRESPRHIRA